MLVERAAELHVGPGLARLGRELLGDVRRVLAHVRVDVDDHAAAMKITGIETLPVAVGGHAGRYGGGYSEGYAEDYKFAVIIVLVRTDEGLTGIGEASLAG